MLLRCRYLSGRELLELKVVKGYHGHTLVSNLRYALMAAIGADADLEEEECGAGAGDLQEAHERRKKKRQFSAVEADKEADEEEVPKKTRRLCVRLFLGTQELYDHTDIENLLTSDITEVLVIASDGRAA